MDYGGNERHLEAQLILAKIVADFEELDRAINAAITHLKENDGKATEIEALLRAREAARQGTSLAISELERGQSLAG